MIWTFSSQHAAANDEIYVLFRDFVDAVGFCHFIGDLVGEVERACRSVGQQRFGFVFGVLRRDHEIGAHTFLHAVQAGSRFMDSSEPP
mgnify:CR=1 FL=1